MGQRYTVSVTYGSAEAASRPAPPSEDVAEKQVEFKRFENLTRKLVEVPKAELDEKRTAT